MCLYASLELYLGNNRSFALHSIDNLLVQSAVGALARTMRGKYAQNERAALLIEKILFPLK